MVTSVSDPDPFHFGQPDPDPFHETDPGSTKSAKILENFHKNKPKSQEYHTFFSKILIFCLTDIYTNLINHLLEKYIFERKKSKKKVDIFFILGRKWSRIRNRIRYSTKRIRGSGSVIPRNGSEDPYQNETDPKHWW